jgi:hypothetical protein
MPRAHISSRPISPEPFCLTSFLKEARGSAITLCVEFLLLKQVKLRVRDEHLGRITVVLQAPEVLDYACQGSLYATTP